MARGIYAIESGDYRVAWICDVRRYGPDGNISPETNEVPIANARLMAAAPALLAALGEAREFIDGQIDVVDGSYGFPEPNKAMRLATEIDEALALATGEKR
jgi:hypothetical protein